jgi:hypothetical protein
MHRRMCVLISVYRFYLCRNVPYRFRIRFERTRNDDDDATEKLYTLCKVVKFKPSDFKGAETRTIEEDDE